MSLASARAPSTSGPTPFVSRRLRSSARRDALLDAVVALVRVRGVPGVSMEAVAEQAQVSRPLVYKHFANRNELLAAAYQREASKLHGQLASEVAAAGTVEGMYRALLLGLFRATVERAEIFTALRAAGRWNSDVGRKQRSRDRDTVQAFAAMAARQYGLERRHSTSVTAVVLGALEAVVVQWRSDPSETNAVVLEETYMAMVVAAYSVAAASRVAPRTSELPVAPDAIGADPAE